MLYPIGIQNLEDIRRGGYVYVDKTALIYKLASTGKYYVLGRPRRFGKSLLISTMEAYFQGKKELFDGLAVASLEKNWIEYPVLHLDFSGRAYNEMDVVAKTLDDALRKWEKEYGSENRSDIPGIRFGNVIEAAYRRSGRQVVILVDEAESIKKLAEANGLSEDECRQKLAMMYIILELMGEYVEVERATSNGRIDALIQTKKYIYIIEIKTDSTPDEALAQIEEKGYARSFADDNTLERRKAKKTFPKSAEYTLEEQKRPKAHPHRPRRNATPVS